jgi:hypothetical protein
MHNNKLYCITILFKLWIGCGLSCWSKIHCGSPTVSEIKVNLHQDFIACTHSDLFQGLTDTDQFYWPNHSKETADQTWRRRLIWATRQLSYLLANASQVSQHYLANQTGPIHLSLKEVTVHSGNKVLKEVNDSNLLIVENPLGILDKQLRTQPIHSVNIITVSINLIKNC